MSQSDPTPAASHDQLKPDAPAKPARNPVERMLVWGVIAIGLVIVGIEARARIGYNTTFSAIKQKLAEVDASGEPDAALSMNDAHKLAAFSPKVYAVVEVPPAKFGDARVWHNKLTWFSLAKTYELTLVMDGDQDGEQTVLEIETANPPKEEEPEMVASTKGEGMPDEGMGEHDPGAAGGPPAGGAGPGGGGGGGGRRLPGMAGLMTNEAVAAELNLTEEQQAKIASLQEILQVEATGIREIFGRMRDADESEQVQLREQAGTIQAGIDTKAKDALNEILDEAQMTRLQQISWQQSRESPLLTDEVAAIIALTDDQRTQLKGVSEELSAAMESAERSERGAIRDAFKEKYLAVLTEQQQTQWSALLGEPFEMPAPARGGQGGGPGGGSSGRPQRPE